MLIILFVLLLHQRRKKIERMTISVQSSLQEDVKPLPVLAPKVFKELDDHNLHHLLINSINAKLSLKERANDMQVIQKAETIDRLFIVADIFDVYLEKGGLIVLCDKFGIPMCKELQAAMECFDAREHLNILNEIIPHFEQNRSQEDKRTDEIFLAPFDERFKRLSPLSKYAVTFARKNAELFC